MADTAFIGVCLFSVFLGTQYLVAAWIHFLPVQPSTPQALTHYSTGAAWVFRFER